MAIIQQVSVYKSFEGAIGYRQTMRERLRIFLCAAACALIAAACVGPLSAHAQQDSAATTSTPEATTKAPSQKAANTPAEILAKRERIAKIHKPLGIATWGAMTLTVFLGTVQYANRYGFFDGIDGNPCAHGNALFGQSQCSGKAWPHLLAAGLTGALYISSAVLAFLMPESPLAKGKSEYARDIKTHKVLRWVHLIGMVAQIGLGIVVANPETFGMNRANDYGTLQALSTVHLGVGLITWGALTGAAAVMLF